jgi:DNA-binding MurR/RpiR family transcriptional regulator
MEEKAPIDVIERIQELRPSLSASHERIAVHILEQPLDSALLTATELAQVLDMDPATVVRFAQKMGFRGYLELKESLRALARRQPRAKRPLDSLGQAIEYAKTSLMHGFEALWDSLDRGDLVQFAEFVGTPCRTLILTDEASHSLGTWLAMELRSRAFHVVYPGGNPDAQSAAMLTIESYDRALILEVEATPLLGHQCQELSRKGVRILAISASPSSPVPQHADVSLRLSAMSTGADLPQNLVQVFSILFHAVDTLHQSNGIAMLEQDLNAYSGDMKP